MAALLPPLGWWDMLLPSHASTHITVAGVAVRPIRLGLQQILTGTKTDLQPAEWAEVCSIIRVNKPNKEDVCAEDESEKSVVTPAELVETLLLELVGSVGNEEAEADEDKEVRIPVLTVREEEVLLLREEAVVSPCSFSGVVDTFLATASDELEEDLEGEAEYTEVEDELDNVDEAIAEVMADELESMDTGDSREEIATSPAIRDDEAAADDIEKVYKILCFKPWHSSCCCRSWTTKQLRSRGLAFQRCRCPSSWNCLKTGRIELACWLLPPEMGCRHLNGWCTLR